MTGDAETFYSTVNSLQLDGFNSAFESIQDRINELSNPLSAINQAGIDYNGLSQNMMSFQGSSVAAENMPDMTENIPSDIIKEMVPMQRVGNPKEVASLINYLIGAKLN